MWSIVLVGLVVAWIVASYVICRMIETNRPDKRQVTIKRSAIRRRAGYWTRPENADTDS